MVKYIRNYELIITFQTLETLTIRPPFTIEFDVTRNYLGGLNHAVIRIYNLNEANRNKLRKDVLDYGLKNFKVDFKEGYGDTLSTVFKGTVTFAHSSRNGVDFITEIQCFDGGYAGNNAVTSQQFIKGTTNQAVVDSLVNSLKTYGVDRGAITTVAGSLSRGNSYSGSTLDVLRNITGGGLFIDNEKVNILKDNEVIDGDVPIISSETGLLGVPVREANILHFEMLFEPYLHVAQKIQLKSTSATVYNGFYKVVELHHRGMISDAVCGDAITSVGLWNYKQFEGVVSAS